ncbi:MAG: hypothetical protein ABSC94_12070 [Polyangiaceae bacterium]
MAAFVLTLAARVEAVEREQQLGADAGPGILVAAGKTEVGGAIAIHWTYGLTDAFNLMLEASGSVLSLRNEGDATHQRPGWILDADVGVGYVFDVLQWVPYAGVLVGGYGLSGGSLEGGTKILPGAVVALGLDYRLTRTVAVGVALRQHMLVTDTGNYPSFTQALARLETTWGW